LAALDGLRVAELGHYIAGPNCTQALAVHGAEVVKVEPPQGDGGRMLSSIQAAHLDPPPMFGVYNRGKRGFRIDLKTSEGLAIVRSLVADADVLVESSTPGAMQRLGLASEQLLEEFPRLVYASVSGFGWSSAANRLRGVDLIVQAESGMMMVTGAVDGPPTKVGFTVVDAACGHALCHGILAALFQRERTGRGRWIRTSLYDMAINLQAAPVSEFGATGVQPQRFGNSAPHTSPADLFDCRDGQIIVAAYLQPHWRALLDIFENQALGDDPRFATPQKRGEHRAEVYGALAHYFCQETVVTWLERLRSRGILVAQVKGYEEVLADVETLSPGLVDVVGDHSTVRNPIEFVGLGQPASTPYKTVEPDQLAFGRQAFVTDGVG
jgi:crotonobetainyl-CoA:carnitine CoA-transferase CaiB-like acyl-CoA transferase